MRFSSQKECNSRSWGPGNFYNELSDSTTICSAHRTGRDHDVRVLVTLLSIVFTANHVSGTQKTNNQGVRVIAAMHEANNLALARNTKLNMNLANKIKDQLLDVSWLELWAASRAVATHPFRGRLALRPHQLVAWHAVQRNRL